MNKYGLIGEKLSHSFSKSFFTEYFSKNEIEASYENLEFSSEKELLDFLSTDVFNFRGLNVTLSYKEIAFRAMDEITPEAKAIGAINTIQVRDHRLIGHNTDCYGFQQMIKPFLDNNHHRAIILGTGGASKAVEYVLKKIGIDCIFISREKSGKTIFTYSDINQYMLDACKCIVNTTPVGMFPNSTEMIDLPYEFLTEKHLVIDLIYNPEETIFLKKAKEKGCISLNGLTMLHEQALAAWDFWN